MKVDKTKIPGVFVFTPERYGDARGFFAETWNRRQLAAAGVDIDFVQDNHSMSRQAGTLRGLHYQAPPHAQGKLVRCGRGSLLDVAVDGRKGSPTYGQHVGVTLSAEKWNQLLVPVGFAHCFMTLEPDTEVLYKVSNPYSKEHERAIRWNDPALGIEWPAIEGEPTLSERDLEAPLFAEFDSPFTFEG